MLDNNDLATELAGMICDYLGNDILYRAPDPDEIGIPRCNKAEPGLTDNSTVFLLEDGRRAFVTVEVENPS